MESQQLMSYPQGILMGLRTNSIQQTLNNSLVDYQWFNQPIFVFINNPQCQSEASSNIYPKSNNIFKQFLEQNIELTLFILFTLNLVTLLCFYRMNRKRNKIYEQFKRKTSESIRSEDNYAYNSRKTSGQDSFSNHEDNRSNRSDSLVAGNKTRNDVFKQNKKDEGNSTNSSPSLRSSNSQQQISIIQGDRVAQIINHTNKNDSQIDKKIKRNEGNSTDSSPTLRRSNSQQLIQFNQAQKSKNQISDDQFNNNDLVINQNDIQQQNNYQLVPVNILNSVDHINKVFDDSQKLRYTKDRKLEFEKNEQNNTISVIETVTMVTQVQYDTKTEKKMIEILQKSTSQQNMAKPINKNQNSNSNSIDSFKFRGLREIETEDYIGQQKFTTKQLLYDSSKFCENGKFIKQYQNIQLLGKGSFGEVYKVQKYLDSKYYAIKRIFFPVNSNIGLQQHKIFREVEALQQLNHENVVRYHTFWLEELELDKLIRINAFDHRNDCKKQLNDTSQEKSSHRISFDGSENFVQFVGNGNESYQNTTSIKQEQIQNSECSYYPSNSSDASLIRKLGYNKQKSANIRNILVLHIEMEYCEKNTLRDFIDQCDRSSQEQLIKNIFVEIVRGVNHIHQQNFIHRDLKPGNIFLTNQNHVRIGDLGLTTKDTLQFIESPHIKSENQTKTTNIGTPQYMAPEVKDKQYGAKADIYSLGIIYFELIYKMKTQHEKNRLIKELIENRFLPPNLQKTHPKEYQQILRMTFKDEKKRPTAQEILNELTIQ